MYSLYVHCLLCSLLQHEDATNFYKLFFLLRFICSWLTPFVASSLVLPERIFMQPSYPELGFIGHKLRAHYDWLIRDLFIQVLVY